MYPDNLYNLINESADWFRRQGVDNIDFGVILGSGLGGVADQFKSLQIFQLHEIPNMAVTAVVSHKGAVHYVSVGDKKGLVFMGRVHFYEGHPMWQVAYPVRILKALGASILITTGAAGGLNPEYGEGDIVVLRDHINLMPESPLRGPHDPRLGVRFPDMSAPYPKDLRMKFLETADSSGVEVREGVYAGLSGPSLETRAEYGYLNGIGADLVAMSIIPEVLVAVQSEIAVLGVCVVSNVCFPPERISMTTVEDVISTVSSSAKKVGEIVLGVLSER